MNECSNLVTNFGLKEVDGRKFLILTKQVFLGICPWNLSLEDSFAMTGDYESREQQNGALLEG